MFLRTITIFFFHMTFTFPCFYFVYYLVNCCFSLATTLTFFKQQCFMLLIVIYDMNNTFIYLFFCFFFKQSLYSDYYPIYTVILITSLFFIYKHFLSGRYAFSVVHHSQLQQIISTNKLYPWKSLNILRIWRRVCPADRETIALQPVSRTSKTVEEPCKTNGHVW